MGLITEQKPHERCKVLRPNKQEFSRPFVEYVCEQFKKDPDCAMFKVIPPRGWSPRPKSRDYSSVDSMKISTPIRQVVRHKTILGCLFSIIVVRLSYFLWVRCRFFQRLEHLGPRTFPCCKNRRWVSGFSNFCLVSCCTCAHCYPSGVCRSLQWRNIELLLSQRKESLQSKVLLYTKIFKAALLNALE